jgi:hypothetical protein
MAGVLVQLTYASVRTLYMIGLWLQAVVVAVTMVQTILLDLMMVLAAAEVVF